MKRRSFLLSSLGTTASSLAGVAALKPARAQAGYSSALLHRLRVPEIFKASLPVPSHSRVMIIGTGFGGSVSAYRLAQAGIEVTMLERGFRWPTQLRWRASFTNDINPDGRGFWFRNLTTDLAGIPRITDKFGGVLDVHEFENMRTYAGACVGGGSVVYNGVSIQPSRADFEHIFQGRVDFEEMDTHYYPLVRSMLRVSTPPQDIVDASPFRRCKVWSEEIQAAGIDPLACPSVLNWDALREELQFRRRRSAVGGESPYGNSNGTKTDLTQTYLAKAEATGLVKVHTGQQVESISYDGSLYHVQIKQIDPTGRVLSQSTKTCEKLIMAAGSMGTTKLLLRAQAEGTMPHLSAEIGKGWGTNGDVILVRSGDSQNGLAQSSPCLAYCRTQAESKSVTLEAWYTAGVPIPTGTGVTFGLVANDGRGQIRYNRQTQKIELDWSQSHNEEVMHKAKVAHARLLEASGTNPGTRTGLFKEADAGYTAHPLGGVVMGEAADTFGRVHGYPGLYVLDGSLVPGSTGAANPSLTIAALAERNIAEIIEQDLLA